MNRSEIQAAVDIANGALDHLEQADAYLRSAGRWGVADIMGGGVIITGIKRQKMRAAQREIDEANRRLKQLAALLRQMDNLYLYTSFGSEGLSFLDYCYTGSAVDIMVQNQIRDAQDQLQDEIAKLLGIIDALQESLF